jgi:hypothetical protein
MWKAMACRALVIAAGAGLLAVVSASGAGASPRGTSATGDAPGEVAGALTPGGGLPGVTQPRAVEVLLPPDAAPSPALVGLLAVSCPAAGRCAAGGFYLDTSGFGQAMLAAQSRGRWHRATKLAMPADAFSNPNGAVTGLACTGVGACVAVGAYSPKVGREQGFRVTESAGRWGNAVRPALPANAAASPDAALVAVACPKAGSCTSVGNYVTKTGDDEGMTAAETRGRWQRAAGITAPVGAATDPELELLSVACPVPGSCTAAGFYEARSGVLEPTVAQQVNGRWLRATRTRLPHNASASPEASLSSVTCTGVGSCVAVGSYLNTSGRFEALAVTETRGGWALATVITPPPGAAANPDASLNSVSCPKAGFCTAVGYYTDKGSHRGAMLVTMTNGRWRRASAVLAPPNAGTGARQFSLLFAVACRPRASCVSGGSYLDTSGNEQAMALATPVP